MAFANFSVLAVGSLLMGVPVLLHLMMRQRPRHQVFPTLRFLRLRHVANKRQMQVRNWLLLAMRLAAIGLLAVLFARPSVDSAGLATWLKVLLLTVLAPLAIAAFVYSWAHRKGTLLRGATGAVALVLSVALAHFGYQAATADTDAKLGDAQAPVAAALVFDTSPRMGLRHQSQTRLDEARRTARELLKQLPADSEVAIVDAATTGTLSIDLGAAANIVDSLRLAGSEYPLSDLVLRGIELVSDAQDKRKEVYVLTELSKTVWQETAFSTVRARLTGDEELSLFILDVGVEEPRNIQLGQLRLSSDSLAKGQPLRIETEVTSLRMEGEVHVDVLLEKPDNTRPVVVDGELLLPELTRRRRQTLTLSTENRVPVDFPLSGIPPGMHNGQVRVSANDGLNVDDVRYFTIEVRPPHRVLLAVSAGASPNYVKQAIAPDEFVRTGMAAFDCLTMDADELSDQPLEEFQVVALLDPLPLKEVHWTRLRQYVEQGGSLAIFLGRNALGRAAADFNQLAEPLLPGPLRSYWRTAPGQFLFLSPASLAHPVLSLFRQYQTSSWDEAPVYQHWVLGMLKPGANIVAPFSNNHPAIIESVVGDGRVVVMTTPVSDRRNDKDRPAWNRLPPQLPFFMLMNGLFPYLAGQSDRTWNYEVGDLVTISTEALDRSAGASTWRLITPQGDWQNVRSEEGLLTVGATGAPGTYRIRPGTPHQRSVSLAANLQPRATDVRRLDIDELDAVLGKGRYTFARGTQQLSRGIGRARVGRELFPFLILVVVGLLAMESLLANRFYSTSGLRPDPKGLQVA